MKEKLTRNDARPEEIQKLIETKVQYYDSMTLAQVAVEDNRYLENLKESLWADFEVATNKRNFIEFRIRYTEDMFYTDKNKEVGIADHPDTYELTVWAFHRISTQPNCKISTAKSILWDNDILLNFSQSNMNCHYFPNEYYLTENNKGQKELIIEYDDWYDHKKIKDLNADEIWLEAIQYLVYGCQYAYFLGFLKEQIEKINNGIELQKKLETTNENVDRLKHKQQIYLLHALGFFELEKIKDIPATKMGVLLSHLLNRNEKNCNTFFRERYHKEKGGVMTDKNTSIVNDLLQLLGIKDVK